MSINDHLAVMLVRTLAKHGFDVTLQRQVDDGGDDFTPGASGYLNVATVKAVWDNPRRMIKGTADGGFVASAQRYMTIAYRDDLKDAASAVGLRVIVGGVATNVLAITPIGDKVGLRLMLDVGTEAA
ncbi:MULTISPECIES: hypothetical protein [unclassified Mesorhizobium]|uniref:hypothetical protein n=1 Tax=unclassified Mesorhizobium TaxID=325217 RepID=UPI00142F0A79|nr:MULTISPECIES: hypothetical protein [unclassified Mesorhizobium]